MNMKWILPSYLCWFLIGLRSMTVVSAGNDEAKFLFCYGSNPLNETYKLKNAVQILNHPEFDSSRPTVLYIHGHRESPRSPTVQLIIDAYTERATHNILILDWSTLADGSYPTAVLKSSKLGPAIAAIFVELFDKGLPHPNLHILGYDLGAHLGGQIARTITKISDGIIKLQRVTGLDPTFAQYYPPIGGSRAIARTDATWVDVIHTDMGRFGTSTGTVDYYVNGGVSPQPGCPIDVPLSQADDKCSHQRSVEIYAESATYPTSTFLATNTKYKSITIVMGINSPVGSTPGDYDVSTNADCPYSKST